MLDKQFEKALDLFEKSLEANPGHPDVLHDKAVCLINLDRKAEAVPLLNEAVSVDPDNSYRYSSRGFLLYLLGDVDNARKDYHEALRLDPEDAITQNNLELLEEKTAAVEEKIRQGKLRRQMNEMLDDRKVALPETDKRSTEPASDQLKTEKDEDSGSKVIGKVFTSKKGFREYVSFLRNGFKLKKPKD